MPGGRMSHAIRIPSARSALRAAALGAALAALAPAGASARPLDRADAPAAAAAEVAVDPAQRQALAPQFSGFNVNPLWQAWTYRDRRVQAAAAGFDGGWLRFPAGTAGDAYDWQTGTVPDAFLSHFDPAGELATKARAYQTNLAVKGPMLLADAASLAAAAHGSSLIVCVNAFTDSVASARALARYVRDHGIPVRYWELANEA